jgi:hypothetical protein
MTLRMVKGLARRREDDRVGGPEVPLVERRSSKAEGGGDTLTAFHVGTVG